jgi:osmotically-inducible protein OsmY
MIMDRQNSPEAAGEARARAPLAQGGMLGGGPVQAGWAEFGQTIERRIMERTWRRIRQLRVEVYVGRVVVQGQTPWYYAKQLAILAVQEALREAGVTAVADVRIMVSAPLGRGRHLAPV